MRLDYLTLLITSNDNSFAPETIDTKVQHLCGALLCFSPSHLSYEKESYFLTRATCEGNLLNCKHLPKCVEVNGGDIPSLPDHLSHIRIRSESRKDQKMTKMSLDVSTLMLQAKLARKYLRTADGILSNKRSKTSSTSIVGTSHSNLTAEQNLNLLSLPSEPDVTHESLDDISMPSCPLEINENASSSINDETGAKQLVTSKKKKNQKQLINSVCIRSTRSQAQKEGTKKA